MTDATIPWPEEGPQVELGTLTMMSVAADNDVAAKELLFLSALLTDGIEPFYDPLIADGTAPTLSRSCAAASRAASVPPAVGGTPG